MGAVHELFSQILEGSVLAARGARRCLEQRLEVETHYRVRQAIERALVGRGTEPAEAVPQAEEQSRPATVVNRASFALLPQEDTALADLAVFRDAPFAPELVVVPAGEIMMGSTENEKGGYEHERPRHRVTIGQRFAIGRYPVTFAEYVEFCTKTKREKPGDEGWGRKRRPLINVSWQDAQDYIAWLSQETGRSYRLPSEAEWEYACRAGTATRYSFGDAIAPKDANYADSGLGRTSEVGAYPANPWGLHDMHGNVWEWVEDDWHENYQRAPTDGSAWRDAGAVPNPRLCVLRGGSWGSFSWVCRSAFRSGGVTESRDDVIGFRVARTLS